MNCIRRSHEIQMRRQRETTEATEVGFYRVWFEGSTEWETAVYKTLNFAWDRSYQD